MWDNRGMTPKDRAYVFVAEWPAGLSEEARGAALCEACGLSAYDGMEAARRAAPLFVCRAEPDTAARSVGALRAQHIAAMSATHAELAGLLGPPAMRRLCPAEGAPEPMYLAHFDRGVTAGFAAADIRLLVRGRTRVVTAEVRVDSPTNLLSAKVNRYTGMPEVPAPVVRSRSAKYTELLDLHLRDGTAYRLDASRFSFLELLGRLGVSDIENTDRAAVVLAEQAPAAQVDTGFGADSSLTALTPDFMSVRAARGGTSRGGHLAFDLYSAILGRISLYRRGKRSATGG
ncbi:MAG: hypothetical protein HBSAPP03_19700 [Phycisphaerae bacterium]|nr:MAG: hypothetical protein HBSAPP03_19700 [Phycisphaerae bacterium]